MTIQSVIINTKNLVPRQISQDHQIVRLVKNIPRITRKRLQEHLANEGDNVSLNTAYNTLHEAELHRRLRKTPLLKDIYIKARLRFAKVVS